MKLLTTLLLGVCLAVSVTNAKPSPKECKCWDGYEPKIGADGPECSGISILRTVPCNESQPPQCKCSGNVTGILKDETGIWCSTYAEGKETKRWECENKDEWNKFYEEYPDYKR
ncbi:hypothetical protein ILUMI_09275 [Ignelater luminosus]|uniref:Uncharacterized protein n=1 Tax=Ignelater luminosus TaxID=2038154 RepID=A0A8K0D632_IGNLU|nr:hypothetical protein ILUMI_09275 [Ignelater luminosus]